MTNLLVAIANLVKNPVTNLAPRYRSANKMNSMGDSLEFYIKDLLCNSLGEDNLEKKNTIYEKHFSYFGNQNNPPDFIIKNGDAIEVKKIESFKNSLALNSSPPKNRLRISDARVLARCKKCDGGKWKEKELFYVVGNVKRGVIKYLYFVQGTCYAADHEIYDRVHAPIKKEVDLILDSLGLEKAQTVELGKIKKVDPLGITELRIRGMWAIENPVKVFDYVAPIDQSVEFSVNVIMLKEKYLSFPAKDRKTLRKLASDNFFIKDIKIKSPNNPAKLLDAKLLSFTK
jgi:hypothetical protein